MLPEVLPTVDPELGALVHGELDRHGVKVQTRSTVTRISRSANGRGRLRVDGLGSDQGALGWDVDLVLVVVGVRPDTDLLANAGAQVGARGAVAVDDSMATGLPHVWAAGDCVVTHHRLLGVTYLPLGTTAHKQGRVAGEMLSAAKPDSLAASAPKSSRCSISSPPAPGFVNMKQLLPATHR